MPAWEQGQGSLLSVKLPRESRDFLELLTRNVLKLGRVLGGKSFDRGLGGDDARAVVHAVLCNLARSFARDAIIAKVLFGPLDASVSKGKKFLEGEVDHPLDGFFDAFHRRDAARSDGDLPNSVERAPMYFCAPGALEAPNITEVHWPPRHCPSAYESHSRTALGPSVSATVRSIAKTFGMRRSHARMARTVSRFTSM